MLLARSDRRPSILAGNVTSLPHHEANVAGVSASSPETHYYPMPSSQQSASRNVTKSAQDPSEPRITATEGATLSASGRRGGSRDPVGSKGGDSRANPGTPSGTKFLPVEPGIGGLEKVRCSGGGSPPSPDRGTYLFWLGPTTRRRVSFLIIFPILPLGCHMPTPTCIFWTVPRYRAPARLRGSREWESPYGIDTLIL